MDKKYQTLEIYRPCISKNLTQSFGENKACIDTLTNKISGTKDKCPFGTVPFYKFIGMNGHNGHDIAGIKGQDIYHAASFAGWWKADHDSEGGLGVDVISNEPLFFPIPIPTELINSAIPHKQDGVQGFLHYVKMRYWHLSLQVGSDRKYISLGTTIGLMGNTGASSGTHLHFAPKWCDINGNGLGSNNGYTGAFDPAPYYTHEYSAKEHADMLRLKVVELSPAEKKDINYRLGMIQKILLEIQSIINKI